jgi:hypothetical protein
MLSAGKAGLSPLQADKAQCIYKYQSWPAEYKHDAERRINSTAILFIFKFFIFASIENKIEGDCEKQNRGG